MHLKPVADKAFCEGLNRIVYHTLPHIPPETKENKIECDQAALSMGDANGRGTVERIGFDWSGDGYGL
jgi:hypothetical protein